MFNLDQYCFYCVVDWLVAEEDTSLDNLSPAELNVGFEKLYNKLLVTFI